MGILIFELITLKSPLESVNQYQVSRTGDLIQKMAHEIETKEEIPLVPLNIQVPEVLKRIIKM